MALKVVTELTGNKLMALCATYNITGKPFTREIEARVANGEFVELINYQANVGPSVRKFVLFHPDLQTEVIRGPLTLLKNKKITCGFNVREALHFEIVYAIGPFTQAELTPLLKANFTAETLDTAAPYDTATALREYLERKL